MVARRMRHLLFAGGLVAGALGVGVAAAQPARTVPVVPAASHLAALTAAAQAEMVAQYCAGCHSDRAKAGGLSLAGWTPADAEAGRDKAEKMIRKLRVGMMPPAGARRPDRGRSRVWRRRWNAHGRTRARRPDPGWRPFQRLNRAGIHARDQATASASTWTSPRSCRPTPSATVSTTSPTSRRSRRR